MKKKRHITILTLAVFVFIAACIGATYAAIGKDASSSSNQTEETKTAEAVDFTKQAPEAAPSFTMPQLPRVSIPRVSIEYTDEVTGKYPSDMTPEEKKTYEERAVKAVKAVPVNRQKNAEKSGMTAATPSSADFKMENVEFISVNTKDPSGRTMTVKAEDGNMLELSAPSYINVVKNIDISELQSGEKLMIHYMTVNEKKEVLAVTAGKNLMHPMQAGDQPAGEFGFVEGPAAERLKQILDIDSGQQQIKPRGTTVAPNKSTERK